MRNKKLKRRTGIHQKTISGTLEAHERGFAFVIPDDRKKYKDLFIPRSSLFGALDGDKVLAVRIRGSADEGKIIAVTERGMKRVTGVFDRGRVYPDNFKLPEIGIPFSLSAGAKDGDKVFCEITSYPKNGLPKGKILEILGESGDMDAEELAILRAHGLYEEFPEEVTLEAENAANEEISTLGRRDFTDKLIFTVDGEDTRDIDDAISLEVVDGNFVLGVHIADVSHYVKPHSCLDGEAYGRATSVYLPDRVLPMLPKSLSNGACSLDENKLRYALSCIMTFDKEGERLGYKICESVICSRHKMTYPAVNAICNNDLETCEKFFDIVPTVYKMKELCDILERRRKARGEVDLDLRESKIYIGEDGEIIIPDYERGIAERMIEQFMIAANEAVAEFLQSKKAPCLYRVHEPPAMEKAENLAAFLRELGIDAKFKGEIKPEDFQRVLLLVKGGRYETLVGKVVLRSMQKARYCEENLKHFGLASSCYCHFTSPIRRYPDLFVHRVLKCVLHGKDFKKYLSLAPEAADDCSERERIAEDTERKVDDLYKAVYMSERIGEIYEATVSGVSGGGIFLELENTVEGFVPIDILPADRYEFIPERFLLKGGRHSYRAGDKLKVRVENPDFGRMRVMFSLV